ncbi:MAG: hypothetical protein FWC41_02530 [Firmicutes bacterium]|nr:hypothetical protein [Bacillota bacterium]
MSIYFRERFKDYEKLLELENMGLNPLFDLFKDMLLIDVYFITGIIRSYVMGLDPNMEIVQLELAIADEEFKRCPNNKGNKKSKKDQELLVDHYNNILNKTDDIEKTWDAIDNVKGTVADILIYFFIIRAKILCYLDNSINMTIAIAQLAKNELKNDGLTDKEIKESLKDLNEKLNDNKLKKRI